MAYAMTANEFRTMLLKAANIKTLYTKAGLGAPLGYGNNRTRYENNCTYNKNRKAMIEAASDDTFVFDCITLGKCIMGGWNANLKAVYGGTQVNNENENYKKGTFPTGMSYGKVRVPDYGTEIMIANCKDVSTDFSKIAVGEALWIKGHFGYYIGDGLAVECSPKWANDVQITAVLNIGKKSGYNGRTWSKHGKFPWIDYATQPTPEPTPGTKISINTPPVLKVGSKNGDVKIWQQLMVNNGISVGNCGIDGDFGSATKAATIDFQKKKGLVANGIVDEDDWTAGLNSM